MKIKVRNKDYRAVLAIPRKKHQKPARQSLLFRLLLYVLSFFELKKTHFTCKKIGMERLGKKEPCLVLMNHSSFIDLKIASTLLVRRPFHIVCTNDGFVGKNWLMRRLGCIPTIKFVSDVSLVRDMAYVLKTLRSRVLMYPEASYSFDGTATPLPASMGKCLKMFGVPVVMIRTHGAFARDPLYNCLQQRKVDVSAEMEYLLSPADIAEKSEEELNAILSAQFSFDHFRWQQENRVKIDEPFRADGLNRVLYKCPHCLSEGNMEGKGIHITCHACSARYELTEYGELRATEGKTKFSHIPAWYAWERAEVKRELEEGSYRLDVPVDIAMLVNTDCLYRVGEGRLVHTAEGFCLTGCAGELEYTQKPTASYSLYSDFFWYEIGDVICIGNPKIQYYCFPKGSGDIVAKTRLAAEELYQLKKREKTPIT